jgi:hypothetical protein
MTIREILAMGAAELSPKTKIFIVLGIAAVVLLAVFGGAGASWLRVRGLEHDVRMAKEQADNKEAFAAAKETESEEYRLKAEKLEGSLVEIQQLAKKQDETIEQFEKNVVTGARRDSANARSVRALESTGDELCRKLEELGHGCN